ncbi:MAG: MazG family protein [Acetatifactor muris]|nr:MazG family protein [Acetatifactor muris]MCM1527996.1 MazG family protein [Bacteroides sp.]
MARYTYEDFLHIIATLRGENGCPWDREQTHMSLRPCMMEEAAEVMAGIRIYDETGDYDNLREELGDVLLQVVMHAQIAGEEGIFTMDDVVHEVAEKMVRRHPHVFGDVSVDGSGQVLENWEEIKRKEKEGKKHTETPLREIPRELPALTRAVKTLKKVDRLYEPGRDYAACVTALEEAVRGLKACEPSDYDEQIAERMGDALMILADMGRICKLSPEQILTDKVDDMVSHYDD